MSPAPKPEVRAKINAMKRDIVRACAKTGEGHVPSAFSIMDLLWVLYDGVLRVDPKNPGDEARDRFVLSKGHGSLGLYAVLAAKGFFPAKEFERFASFDGILGGHPDANKIPGVEASTGSLGHGFPFALGQALALKIKKNPARVVAMIGDGECNEGTVWEAAQLAAHHRLNNLTCVLDHNHSNDRALKLGDMTAKFASFGWNAVQVDGHDHEAIRAALTRTDDARPLAVVAETVKGQGCKRMENNHAWHHKPPTPAELTEILQELA